MPEKLCSSSMLQHYKAVNYTTPSCILGHTHNPYDFAFCYQLSSKFKKTDKKKIILAPWPVWLRWLEHCPIDQRVTSSIPSHGTCLDYGFSPQSGLI